MKKILIHSCLLLTLSFSAFGQQIKTKNIELDDLMTLLGTGGYELFSYDISEMLNEQYNVVIAKKEYLAGNEINSSNLAMVQNKMLLTDIPESSRQIAIDEGLIDPTTNTFARVEKISFGLYPSDNDSTKLLNIDIPNVMRSGNIQFKLRGLTEKDSGKTVYFYHTRPFKIKEFKENEFIPLILLGSSWVDEQFNIFRFCGEREIEPDLSSEILEYVPHHYIIGVKFAKK
jgi:hypothetical protein